MVLLFKKDLIHIELLSSQEVFEVQSHHSLISKTKRVRLPVITGNNVLFNKRFIKYRICCIMLQFLRLYLLCAVC